MNIITLRNHVIIVLYTPQKKYNIYRNIEYLIKICYLVIFPLILEIYSRWHYSQQPRTRKNKSTSRQLAYTNTEWNSTQL